MKKIIISIALFLTFGLCANAQKDNFFTDWDDISNGLDRTGVEMPALPGGHGGTGDVTAPLGSGLLILTALGGACAIKRRK